jgi:hypothetical protein
MYCLFFDVLYIVCVYMYTELLPAGGYPIAVKYIISYQRGGPGPIWAVEPLGGGGEKLMNILVSLNF